MTIETAAAVPLSSSRPTPSLALVIFASSGGTLIEWYDFYLYQYMGVYLSRLFFPPGVHQGLLGLLFVMGTVGLGQTIRPLGGLLFGAMGDRLGRKYSFVFTLLLMGVSTTLMGCLPVYESIGYFGPAALLVLRICQGLAAGGEAGGAVSYVAEYSPNQRRGWYLGILYAMSPLGVVVSLAVVYLVSNAAGPENFAAWGWRIPFLLAGVLVTVSLYFRLRLRETAVFEALVRSHQESKAPIRELFTRRENLVRLLLAVFGATAGQAGLGSIGLVFAPGFMQAVLKIDVETTSSIALTAVVMVIPFYLVFGWVTDRVGRRPMIILGSCLALIFEGPILYGVQQAASPVQYWHLVFYNWAQVMFVALVLPAAVASIAELFPTRLRSTGVGAAYNLSNGLLNGFAPLIGFALIAATNNIYTGLIYPLALVAITAVVSLCFVKETYHQVLSRSGIAEIGNPLSAQPIA